MNATKNELQHNTMLHYYIGTTVNGAKGIAHGAFLIVLWLLYG